MIKMKLRNREKSKPAVMRAIEYENEEDVDDPEDDSDVDPEWEEAELKPELGGFGGNSGRKRKSFIPLQMQDTAKVRIVGESSQSNADKPSSSKAEESSIKKTSTSSKTPRGSTMSSLAKDKKRHTPLYREKIKPLYVQRNMPIYKDRTLEKEVENKVEEEGAWQVERERDDMYSEVELMNELGLNLSDYNLHSNSLHEDKKSNIQNKNLTPNKKNLREQGYDSVQTKTMTVTDSKGATTTCQFKVLKKEHVASVTTTSTINKQVALPPPAFSHGDFLKDITKKGDWIWQVDGMNLLQKFVPVTDPNTGMSLYKSSFTYDGLNALNSPKFQKISAVIVNKIKNETFVRVKEDLNPLEVKLKTEPVSEDVVSSSQTNDSDGENGIDKGKTEKNKNDASSIQPNNSLSMIKEEKHVIAPAVIDTPSIANYKNTFKNDFTVFLQALISQCLDPTFLRTCYNEKDEYFIEKIKTIDDVLEAKKFSLMSLSTFPNNDRILYAIHTYPVIEEKQLPAIKMENLNCVVCAEQGLEKLPSSSSLCLELTGEPYERNTLLHVQLLDDVDDDLKVLRVCINCSKILKLYSKMCHAKYLIFKQCERSVHKIKEKQGNKMEASEVIISLLNNEPWVETKLLQTIRDWTSVDDLKKES